MTLNLAEFETKLSEAVRTFWKLRRLARERNTAGNRADAGTRGAVTSGTHLNGFVDLIKAVVVANGLDEADVKVKGCTLPGYFRATKDWDVLVVHRGVLVAAIELKSQVGSVGNNLNNRAEEVLGSATDLWTAYREGAFQQGVKPGMDTPRPFLGWLMVFGAPEDLASQVRTKKTIFPVFEEFQNTTYQRRYELLCEKLMSERLYDAAALLVTPASAEESGEYTEVGVRRFIAELAAHVAKVAALDIQKDES